MESSSNIITFINASVKTWEIDGKEIFTAYASASDDNRKKIREIQKNTMNKGIIAEWSRLNSKVST